MRRPIGLWWMIGRGVVRILGSSVQVVGYGAADRLRRLGRRRRKDRPPR